MKKLLSLFFIMTTFVLSANATNWVKISDTWYIDTDTMKYDENNAKVWIKQDVSGTNQGVKWMYYLEMFEKGTNQHLTLNEIAYDPDMQIVENIMYPYGELMSEFQKGSVLETVRDQLFQNR